MSIETDGADGQWAPVPAAAAQANVPVRSAYNWARSKRVRSRTENGVVLVSVDDLRTIATTRARPNSGTRAGGGAGNGAETASLAQVDGDLCARLFELLESGLGPTEIVKRERLAPPVVRSIYRDFRALHELGKESKTPLETGLQELRSEFEAFRQEVAMELSRLDDGLRRNSERIEMAIGWLEQLPVPARGQFQCWHCKATDYPRVHVRCGGCGQDGTWGFRP